MSLLHGQKSFLETNAWQKAKINSLRYNTSQPGSVIPLGWGTFRQSINLIALGDYRGPGGGKKGKSTGPLPIGGTHATSKGKGGLGSGGKKGAGGKKSQNFSVDVAFALCQGPVDIGDENKVWSNAGIAFFQSVGLNLYEGNDGQAADPVFAALGQDVGYSGTCYVTGTPMDLGSSPVLPNLSFEITGFEAGTAGPNYTYDANPAVVVEDFLTNSRYGAGWPSANLDPDIATLGTNNYADYTQAGLFAISPVLDAQTEAAAYISEVARLTNVAIVWSGSILKFIPYGDLQLSANGAVWVPNLTPVYSFNDDDFLPWNSHIDASEPQIGEDDPVLITRSNPADATNWMSIEYLDRENDYNKTVIPQFDQASIDLYGVRTEAAINGSCFCHKTPAELSLRLLLQRSLYVRNTYRFQVGWQYALLEPMDIVLLTDERCGLDEQPVRITAIEENENGDLIIDAEEIPVDTPIEVGCAIGGMDWRNSLPRFISTFAMPPDRLDMSGNSYVPDPYDGSTVDHWTIYDGDGAIVDTLTYDDLWQKIFAFAGVSHAPVLGDGSDAYEYFGYYHLWPILNGEYVLAFIQRRAIGEFAFWWALLEPGSLDVLGAYYYRGFTHWPYTNGVHVLGALSDDQPILVQAYAFLGATNAVLGTLPSIDEFKDGTYSVGVSGDPFRIANTAIFPVGGETSSDTDFGDGLFALVPGNESRNWGFILPASDGTPNLYIYINRDYMDYVAASTLFVPDEIKNIIQPAYPNGCMVKIPLGDISFAGLAAQGPLVGVSQYRGAPSGAYEIDNAAWRESDNTTPAIPFLDEYTHISDDTAGGDDVYALQTGIIDRGNGKFWVIFYMVGRADAEYRNANPSDPYEHPIYERIRVYEYTQSTETAREIAKITCILHDVADVAPDSNTATWESSNDNFQIFTATDEGRIATIHIYGPSFKRPFCTVRIPLDLST